ncbi:MAG: arginine--tRNA ligase [Pirellulales bacterium]
MNVLALLRERFRAALSPLVPDAAQLAELLDMVRPSTDPKFGDYQANFAMPLGKQLGRPPREIAAEIVERLDVEPICHPPELAGPGFINLRVRDDWLAERLCDAARDIDRLGIPVAREPRTYIVDYSAPNVAKEMHVGHIRSTVIGDALCRVLRFLGHRVVSDNHIGDWGTQFGMILYGWKHFRGEAAYEASAVTELARLYRLVHQLVDYHEARAALPDRQRQAQAAQDELARAKTVAPPTDKAAKNEADKLRRRLETAAAEATESPATLSAKLAAVDSDPRLSSLAADHANIGEAVLAETARLHIGDAENLRLWKQFVPPALADIDTIYRRLGVTFDHTLGESFYHDRLAGVVADLKKRGIAAESDGAVCIFVEGFDHPMIVQKRDGAFLYATTDLATIQYRMEKWDPDAILYVVDHRQASHFSQLFAAARRWGVAKPEFMHVSFGTVLGEDGRPFKTRSGDTVGLGALLDEAERRALTIVSENDEAKPQPELSADQRRQVATAVGIAAIKYADLAHNRTSDYVFSYERMLATRGNTSTYIQYAYARVRSIFRKGGADVDALRRALDASNPITITHPAERWLALGILGLSEAIDATLAGYYPHHLTSYLFELATRYSTFYQECDVLKAEPLATRTSRLLLCDLTARTLKLGLGLLGIEVIEQM